MILLSLIDGNLLLHFKKAYFLPLCSEGSCNTELRNRKEGLQATELAQLLTAPNHLFINVGVPEAAHANLAKELVSAGEAVLITLRHYPVDTAPVVGPERVLQQRGGHTLPAPGPAHADAADLAAILPFHRPGRANAGADDFLTLHGIPPQVFDYKLGNRSALDWVIDQYRVKTDKRSGITNDPNNLDDETYILRLIKQVISVSLETVEIVNNLPPLEILDDSHL